MLTVYDFGSTDVAVKKIVSRRSNEPGISRAGQFATEMRLYEDLFLQVHYNGEHYLRIYWSVQPVLTNNGVIFTNSPVRQASSGK